MVLFSYFFYSDYKKDQNHYFSGLFQFNSSLPLIKEKNENLHIFKPKLALKISPNFMKDLSTKDGNRLDVNNIFNLNRLATNETLEGGIFYEFILDFDADKSIVNQGNGGYSLKPVIRASTVAESGAISGTVNPSDFQTEVIAVSGELEITTYTDATGNFVLSGVPNGVYIVSINPDPESGFESQTFVDVEVVNGEVTSIGNVEL